VPDLKRWQRKERWPPPPAISPEGRIAGLTTTGCVIASCAAWLWVAIRISMCTLGCEHEPGLGGLVMLVIALPFVAAIGLFRATIIRPTDPDASTAWRFGLSVIFAVGVVAGASWIPSLTCPPGTKLSFFGFCSNGQGVRLEAASWVLQRRLIDLAGVIVGFTIIRSRRWVRVTAPVAGLVFVGGTVALLARTLA
jgi:hypothetical protein